MPERIHDRPLQHARDRPRASCLVRMLRDGAMFGRSRSQRLTVCRDPGAPIVRAYRGLCAPHASSGRDLWTMVRSRRSKMISCRLAFALSGLLAYPVQGHVS